MTVRLVATLGHPILREWACPLAPEEIEYPATQALIDDLIETMRYYHGAGLAAPQIMASDRIAAIEVHDNPRYPYKPEIPLTVLINPEIEPLSDETFANNEGCLSVPGLRGVTSRYVEIGVRALDRHGRPTEREVRGLSAVTFQHEVDHLNGTIFVDRVEDPTTFATWEQYERFQRDEFAARAAALVARFGS
jgi:peptide deformylase